MNCQNLLEKQENFFVRNKISILTILIFILLVFQVSAQELKVSNENYETGETVQAELIFSEVPIRNFDISLVKGNEKIPLGAIAIKITDKRYFIYFDIPSSIEKGDYDLIIDNIIFLIDNNLVEKSYSKKVFINNLNPAFYWLRDQKKNTLEEIIYSTAALAKAGLNPPYSELLDKKDSLGCFPAENCNVKDTAIGLIALNELNLDTTKTLNWLRGAQNDVSLGNFKLSISSSSNGTCLINNQSVNIQGLKEINVDEKEINLNCQIPATTKLIHTYLGNSFILESTNQQIKTFNLNDNGCYGTSYKSSCDYESTLYATYSLSKLNEDNEKPLTWLKENYDEFITLHHAFLGLIDSFSYSKEWLVNNQRDDGSWGKKAISLDNTEDILTTAIASEALKSEIHGKKGLNWLKDNQNTNNWNNNILLTAQILFFAFQEDLISDSLSINPGVLALLKDQKDPVRLTLSNKGNTLLSSSVKVPSGISSDKTSLIMNPGETKSIFLTIDAETITEASLQISYNNKSYDIPVLVSDEISSYTTNPLRFVSDKPKVKFSIYSKETKEGDIKFENFGSSPLTEVKLELSEGLKDIITLDVSSFSKVDPGEKKDVFTSINKDKNPDSSSYSGNLTVTSKEGYSSTLTLEVEIRDFKSEVFVPIKIEPVEETEEPEGNVTISEGAEKRRSQIGLVISLILLIIAIVIIIYLIKRSKKKLEKVQVNFPKPADSKRFKEHLRKLEELKR